MGSEFQSLVADKLKVLAPSDSRLYLGQTRFKALYVDILSSSYLFLHDQIVFKFAMKKCGLERC